MRGAYFINSNLLPSWHTKYSSNSVPVDVEDIWCKYMSINSTKVLNSNEYLPLVECISNENITIPSWSQVFSCSNLYMPIYSTYAEHAILSGTFPKISQIGDTITSSTTLIRTNNTLTIGSTVFYPNEFDDNVIPKKIIVEIQGAGAAGGRSHCSNRRLVSGGGGGGGANLFAVVNLENNVTYNLTIGRGGYWNYNTIGRFIQIGTSITYITYDIPTTVVDPTVTSFIGGTVNLTCYAPSKGGDGEESYTAVGIGGSGGSYWFEGCTMLSYRSGADGGDGGRYWQDISEYNLSCEQGDGQPQVLNDFLGRYITNSYRVYKSAVSGGSKATQSRGGGGGGSTPNGSGGQGGYGEGNDATSLSGAGGGGGGQNGDTFYGFVNAKGGRGANGFIKLYY